MRMSSFLFGGIVGAAAVMYFSKNKRPFLFSSFSSAATNVNKMLGGAGGMTAGASTEAKDDAASRNARERVRSIINEDPALKQTVDEIVRDNNATYQ